MDAFRRFILPLILVLVFLSTAKATPKNDQEMVEQVVVDYLAAKKAYNIEAQLKNLTSHDLKTIDYLTLKKAQPNDFTKTLFTRYGEAQVLEVVALGGKVQRAIATVEYNVADYQVIGEKLASIDAKTNTEIQKEIREEVEAQGLTTPISIQDMLYYLVEKIYSGKPLPRKISRKKYYLEKEASGWKIELMQSVWENWEK
jgi:hypothetical protein